MDYLVHLAILIGIYAILGMSYDLVIGHLGMLSIAHAAFWGIGAYTGALLATRFGAPFLTTLIAAALAAATAALLLALLTTRLDQDGFVLTTLAFQLLVFTVLNNWMTVTAGPLGIANLPSPTLFGWHVDTPAAFLVLVICCVVGTHIVVWRMTSGAFGRVLHGIREDERFTESLGKHTQHVTRSTIAVSAGLAGAAGVLYADYVSYIDPTTFGLVESMLIASMVIVGGAGGPWGSVIGAVSLVLLPEALRFIGLGGPAAGNMREMLYGCALVAMMLARPRGLLGRYDFSRRVSV